MFGKALDINQQVCCIQDWQFWQNEVSSKMAEIIEWLQFDNTYTIQALKAREQIEMQQVSKKTNK